MKLSNDTTFGILKSIKARGIRIYRHKKNLGKGMAVRTGINRATGDIILIQDADLEYSPYDYPQLKNRLSKGLPRWCMARRDNGDLDIGEVPFH